MKWTQVIDPLNNIALSVLVAAVPIIFYFLGTDHPENEGLSSQSHRHRHCYVHCDSGLWDARKTSRSVHRAWRFIRPFPYLLAGDHVGVPV